MSIHTGRGVSQDTTISCDVCVVGSGAGGAHVAARLARAGKKVVVLEEGGFHMSRDFDMTERNMVPRLYQERGWRGTADGAIAILQGRAVGGTTVVNWTTCFRTPDWVLDHWAEHHGVRGPTAAALAPHWERVEERLGVEQARLSEVNANNMVLWRGAKKLGWKVELLRRNVARCAHTGYCGYGCPIDAKQSMLVTMIPEAVRDGAEVYANASVERIDTDGRKVRRVVARMLDPETDKPTGVTLTVEAKVTVLSGGGINTPALLLRSGLNGNGRVGRRTYLHPTVGAVGIHEERIEPFTGSPQYVGCHEFAKPGEGMSFLMEAAPAFPSLTAGATFALGEEHQAQLEQLPHMSLAIAILHDGFDVSDPDEGATVTLRSEGRPKVEYRWTPRLEAGLREGTRRGMQLQLAGGASEVRSLHLQPLSITKASELSRLDQAKYAPCQLAVFSAHVMGGCAMGTDPTISVVDSRTLRHHELDDLFVVDGSVYPTSVAVNPQLSIYGLASWASEHVLHAAG
jgi:choline dehydrogenase-like flavoprotein